MTTNFRNLWIKLRRKSFREAFVASEVKRGIPFQLRALMRKRGWSQDRLATEAGLTQGAVSRALDLSYGNLTLNTIIRLAAGLDVAFVGRFVPFTEILNDHDDASDRGSGDVPSFTDEDQFSEMLLASLERRSTQRERSCESYLDAVQRFVGRQEPQAEPKEAVTQTDHAQSGLLILDDIRAARGLKVDFRQREQSSREMTYGR